ncbi:MAG: DUF2997 domain-containing protein [Heliobacteriaceae bacterium]|jgi:hypothetical protein|nr:DUF2997 domain-containing protein [Heliobacteriaceae bacterium]
MAKQIRIKLLPNGEIQMETAGIKGKKCLDYLPFIEQLADAKVVKQELTPEYYQEESVNLEQNQYNYERYEP